jgi:hypothetical protein
VYCVHERTAGCAREGLNATIDKAGLLPKCNRQTCDDYEPCCERYCRGKCLPCTKAGAQ